MGYSKPLKPSPATEVRDLFKEVVNRDKSKN